MLVEALQPDRDLSHTPLFQVAFALQNAQAANSMRFGNSESTGSSLQKDDLDFRLIQVDSGSSKFDLTMTLAETADGLVGGIEYNLDLFDPETIQRMVAHFSILVESFISDPDQAITKAPMLSPAERQTMLIDWNSTELETPIDQCAHQLVESWAKKTPDALAVCFENQSLTYHELDRLAEKLAKNLRNMGVGTGTLVGISTERSLNMVVGIIGVMKSGAAYVPLDPTYPTERLAYMIEDSQISVLLTQEKLIKQLPVSQQKDFQTGPRIICLDTDQEDIAEILSVEKPTAPLLDSGEEGLPQLAYMIYTSGSTGRPKGTMLRHPGLSNLTKAQQIAFEITSNSRVLQFSPLSFDASVWETFMALANGATLILSCPGDTGLST